jgi:hypothetical protein
MRIEWALKLLLLVLKDLDPEQPKQCFARLKGLAEVLLKEFK